MISLFQVDVPVKEVSAGFVLGNGIREISDATSLGYFKKWITEQPKEHAKSYAVINSCIIDGFVYPYFKKRSLGELEEKYSTSVNDTFYIRNSMLKSYLIQTMTLQEAQVYASDIGDAQGTYPLLSHQQEKAKIPNEYFTNIGGAYVIDYTPIEKTYFHTISPDFNDVVPQMPKDIVAADVYGIDIAKDTIGEIGNNSYRLDVTKKMLTVVTPKWKSYLSGLKIISLQRLDSIFGRADMRLMPYYFGKQSAGTNPYSFQTRTDVTVDLINCDGGITDEVYKKLLGSMGYIIAYDNRKPYVYYSGRINKIAYNAKNAKITIDDPLTIFDTEFLKPINHFEKKVDDDTLLPIAYGTIEHAPVFDTTYEVTTKNADGTEETQTVNELRKMFANPNHARYTIHKVYNDGVEMPQSLFDWRSESNGVITLPKYSRKDTTKKIDYKNVSVTFTSDAANNDQFHYGSSAFEVIKDIVIRYSNIDYSSLYFDRDKIEAQKFEKINLYISDGTVRDALEKVCKGSFLFFFSNADGVYTIKKLVDGYYKTHNIEHEAIVSIHVKKDSKYYGNEIVALYRQNAKGVGTKHVYENAYFKQGLVNHKRTIRKEVKTLLTEKVDAIKYAKVVARRYASEHTTLDIVLAKDIIDIEILDKVLIKTQEGGHHFYTSGEFLVLSVEPKTKKLQLLEIEKEEVES